MKKELKLFIDEIFNKSLNQISDLLSEKQPYKSFMDKILSELEICFEDGKELLIKEFEELEKNNATKDDFKELFENANREFVFKIIIPRFRMYLIQEALKTNEHGVVDEENIDRHIESIKDVFLGTIDTHGIIISPILEIANGYEKYL